MNGSRSLNFILIPFLFVIAAGCGQSTASTPNTVDTLEKLLPVKDMQSDLTILWNAIQEMHPAYGIYIPPDSLQKIYKTVAGAINKPLSETDFISTVYPLLSKLGCGHTQLKHSADYKPEKAPHLPFQVLVQNGRAWVTTHQTAALATGDELLSVNGIATADIIEHGADLYAGDGYNSTFKELFLSEYDGFEDACNKYYHWQPPYHLSVRTQKGVLKTMALDTTSAMSASVKQTDNYVNWTEAKNTDYLPLRFLNNSLTAWFETKSYQYQDTIIFQEVFKQLRERGIRNLVLDLRHNTGGDIRVATKLLSYLADAPFHIIGDLKARIPNPAVNHFEKYFDSLRTESFTAGFSPGNKEGADYHIDFKPAFGDLLSAIPLDKRNHFSGQLFVLIDGATFSSAAHTAAAIKTQCKKALFIGRETAGGQDGCSGGTIQHLTLPHTQVVVEFPWMRFVSVIKTPVSGRGIMPDYTVVYSAEDIVNKTDLDIKKAISLVR
ncbi:Peptidase family S41 [Chitinophaga sp. CF118]|uniref:S41 family peptidase n=1 Tax=Chitinophaga sp. CF118 TaxID=1884367 RepID=UPI0008F3214E|nr:S41 family peptidase [Chitinophaga sp. CF118]SFE97249.1 Peptidase family S41 [Chitinophaga sp. CF118]